MIYHGQTSGNLPRWALGRLSVQLRVDWTTCFATCSAWLSFRGPAHRAARCRRRCRQREAIATDLASGVLHARRRHVILNREKWKFIAIHTLHTVTSSWYLQTVPISLNWCCYNNYALFMIIILHALATFHYFFLNCS